jgi:hypothetical protein
LRTVAMLTGSDIKLGDPGNFEALVPISGARGSADRTAQPRSAATSNERSSCASSRC